MAKVDQELIDASASLKAVQGLRPINKMRGTMVMASSAINILGLAFPLLMLQLYDRILANRSISTLVILCACCAIALAFEAAAMVVRSYAMTWIAAQFEHNMTMGLFSRFLREPIQEFESTGTGKFNEILKAIGTVKNYYSGSSYQQLLDLPFCLGYVLFITIISPWVGAVLIVGYLVAALIGRSSSLRQDKRTRDKRRVDLRRANFIDEVLNNVHEVKSMTMELLMIRRFERLQQACSLALARMVRGSDMVSGTGAILNPLFSTLMVAVGAYMVVSQELSVGELAACISLSMRAFSPIQNMGTLFARLRNDSSVSAELDQVLARPALQPNAVDPGDARRAAPRVSGYWPAGVRISDLCYAFPGTEGPPLLSDVMLDIVPGDFVTLVGASGTGRSTLMQCLGGLVEPDRGSIEVNGRPLREVCESARPGRIVYLAPTAKMFHGSLLDNVTMFDPARAAEARRIADALGLTPFVSRLPRGWDTVVGDTAFDVLPPGYRQRFAIVRAFAASPELVLFDDANSAVGPSDDQPLLDYLESMRGKVTIVMVSQRTNFRSLASRFIWLENGKAFEVEKVAGPGAADTAPAAAMSGHAQQSPEPRVFEFEQQAFEQGADPEHWKKVALTIERHFSRPTDFSANLSILLKQLNVLSSARQIAEALPYFSDELDLAGLLNTLARLGFRTRQVRCGVAEIHESTMPCLYVPDSGPSVVLIGKIGEEFRIATDFDADAHIPAGDYRSGDAYFIEPVSQPGLAPRQTVGQILHRFVPQLTQAGVAGLFYGMLVITGTLFIMSVYNVIIPSGARDTLFYLAGGSVFGILLSYFLMRHRVSIQAHVMGRIDYLFGTMVATQLLKMPAAYTEIASVDTQTARLQSFESIRDLFVGPVAVAMLDLPVTLIFLVTLGLLNPLSLIVLILTLGAYAAVYAAHQNSTAEKVRIAGVTGSARNAYLQESIGKMRLIHECCAQQAWLGRFREISAAASMAAYQSEKVSGKLGAVSYFLMMFSALAVLLVTVPAVMDGTLGSGALLASTILIWRVLTPIQVAFTNFSRIERVRSVARQIDGMMAIQGEQPEAISRINRPVSGKIEFSKVSFRYMQSAEPALVNLDFVVNPGQIVAVTGADGAGKSTLFKLVLGLYQPQAGAILVDDIDSRQFNPTELRRMIGYMPEERARFFRATLTQNMRLVRPDASLEDILEAIDMAGGLSQIERLPGKLDYRSGDHRQDLTFTTRKKLSLARAYLTRAPILLLDDPTAGLDEQTAQKFEKVLQALKGKATVLFATHQMSQIVLADVLMVLDKGVIRAMGTPQELLQRPVQAAGAGAN